MCKENKNNDYSAISVFDVRSDVERCALFASRGMHTHVSLYCHERTSKTDTEEKKLLNKAIIFVFFGHKKVFS